MDERIDCYRRMWQRCRFWTPPIYTMSMWLAIRFEVNCVWDVVTRRVLITCVCVCVVVYGEVYIGRALIGSCIFIIFIELKKSSDF